MKVSEAFTVGKEADYRRAVLCAKYARVYWDEVTRIKDALRYDDEESASWEWHELPLEAQEALIIAPTRGGVFTTEERGRIAQFWQQVGI